MVIRSPGTARQPPVFSRDGRLLAVGLSPQQILLAEAATGRAIAHLSTLQPVSATPLAFSADGTRLAASTNQRTLLLWDLRGVRAELTKLGLDWDTPPYPPTEEKNAPALQVSVDLGPLAPETPQRAVVKYTVASALMPLNPEAYLRRGRAHYQLKQWSEAADSLSIATALNPGINDAQVWFELGYACGECGLPEQAIAAYSRSIDLNPNGPGAWNNRGNLYARFGALDKAVVDYSKAIELNAKDGLAWSNRARAHAGLGQWEKTVEDCTRWLELVQGEQQINACYLRALAYGLLARYGEAKADYQKLLELAPTSSLGHNNLSWLLATCPDAKLRDPGRAVQLAQRALELAEQVGNTWNTLGVAHYRAGNWKAAIEALDKSREYRKGGDAFDFFFLAMAHWRLGQKEDGLKWYKQAVAWIEKNNEALAKNPQWTEELRRFRAEAEELMKTKK
jgi:superkiller protein 3